MKAISNLIRKVVIVDAIFILWDNLKEYEHGISFPENISGNEETKLIQATHNKVRRILDIEEIFDV